MFTNKMDSYLSPMNKGNHFISSSSLLHLSPSVSSLTTISRNPSKSKLHTTPSNSELGDKYALARKIVHSYSTLNITPSKQSLKPEPNEEFQDFTKTLVTMAKEMRQLPSIKEFLRRQKQEQH